MRVVSLVPSITETLRDWGLDPVGCTAYCEQPDLPTVGGTKNPDIEAVAALRPDLVCFDKSENREDDAYEVKRLGIRVLTLDVRSVDDVAPELEKLALATGLDGGVEPVPHGLAALDVWAFVPIWRRPWMTIGGHTYGSTLLNRLGVDNVFAEAAEDYPEVTLDQAAEAGPDVVLVPSEPYAFKPPHLEELAGVGPVVEVDGQDLFWWGSRTPAAARRLAGALAHLGR